MTRQITKMAAMVTVLVGLMAGAAMAKNIKDGDIAKIGLYTGMEPVPGTHNFAASMVYGNTFVLNSFGEWESKPPEIDISRA